MPEKTHGKVLMGPLCIGHIYTMELELHLSSWKKSLKQILSK